MSMCVWILSRIGRMRRLVSLWKTLLLTPFKLITVFLHELSHAIACWLTCGRVEGMEVHANEGGVTKTRGGAYWLILPAGCKASNLVLFIYICVNIDLTGTKSQYYSLPAKFVETCISGVNVVNSVFCLRSSVYDRIMDEAK